MKITTQTILDCANSVIARNTGRKEKGAMDQQ